MKQQTSFSQYIELHSDILFEATQFDKSKAKKIKSYTFGKYELIRPDRIGYIIPVDLSLLHRVTRKNIQLLIDKLNYKFDSIMIISPVQIRNAESIYIPGEDGDGNKIVYGRVETESSAAGQTYIFREHRPKIRATDILDELRLQEKRKLVNIVNGKYTINPDKSIDVQGDVVMKNLRLSKIPYNFNIVRGSFNCSYNSFINLEGSPREVYGEFNCTGCDLVTLEGGPKTVHGDYLADYNGLTTLKGGPESVDGVLSVRQNELISLEGGPKYIGNTIDCRYNGDLEDLNEYDKQDKVLADDDIIRKIKRKRAYDRAQAGEELSRDDKRDAVTHGMEYF